MRHRIAGNKLSRNQSLRKATVRDIAKATLVEQRIMTTKAKAKEARKLVDKLITLGKGGSLAHKRRAFAILCDHQLVSRLFNRTSPLFRNRNGGYTRIMLLGNRRGDNAQLVFLELTEKEEIIVSKPKSSAAAKKDAPKAQEPKEKKGKEEVVAVKESEREDTSKPKVEKSKEVKAPSKDVKKIEERPSSKLDGIRKFFRRKTT